jgi:hypothetical protein
MSQAYEVDSSSSTPKRRKLERAGSGKSMQPAVKSKCSVANMIRVVARAKSADPRMTEPQYGLPTDGGAGGPSGSQYGDAVGPSRSAASPRTEPQYGLPTDGGARGPSGSAAASSSSFGPPPPAPPPLQQALEGDTRRDPTDGGARGPSGSAAASSLELGPPPPAPPPLPQALEGDTRRDRKKSRDQLRAEARKLKQPIQESSR